MDLSPTALLAAASSDPDPDARRAAQKQIVGLSSLRVARVVTGTDAAAKLALLDEVGKQSDVPTAVLPILLASIGRPTGKDIEKILRKIRNHKARDLGPSVARGVGTFVTTVAADAGPREVLYMLDWAAGDELDDGEHVRPFVAAAITALGAIAGRALDDLWFATGMTQLFAIGGGDAEPLLGPWLADPHTAELVLRRMFDVHGQRMRTGRDRRFLDWLSALWVRTADRTVLAPALGIATSQNRSIDGKDEIFDWAWSRFVDHPGERVELYQAFESWRDDFIARRNATERARRPGGASAVDHLRVWGPLDLRRMPGVIEESARLATPADWPALVDEVFAIASNLQGDERMDGLVAICRIGHELRNRVGEDNAPPELEVAADRLVLHGAAVIGALKAEGLTIDSLIASRIEDLETSMKLVLRPRERRAASDRDARERAERDAQRERERRQREEEIRVIAEQQRLAVEEAQREAQRRQQAMLAALQGGATTAPSRTSEPQIEIESVDREPFFGAPLATLIDYTRFMVRVRHGGDVMAVMAEHGLDPLGFAACSQAWSQLIMKRPDLAQRFGALMGATWE